MNIKHKLLTVTLLVSIMSVGSASAESNIRSLSSGLINNEAIQDSSDITRGVSKTIEVLGATISQTDMPLDGAFTDGAGNVIYDLSNMSENDNVLTTTVAGEDINDTAISLKSMPVLAQLDEASGVLTTVGGTLDSLGLRVTDSGDYLTLGFINDGGDALTTKLTAVVRPLVINVDGVVKTVGQAIVITPAVNSLIGQVDSSVVVLGETVGQQDNIVLASAGGVVKGVGPLLVQLDGNLTMTPEQSEGLKPFELTELLNDNTQGNLINQLLGGTLLPGETDLLTNLLGEDNNVLAGLTETLDALTGGLLTEEGDLIGQLTGSLDGTSDNPLGTLIEQTTVLPGSLEGLTEGLTGAGGNDIVGGVVNTVDDVTGGLLGIESETGSLGRILGGR